MSWSTSSVPWSTTEATNSRCVRLPAHAASSPSSGVAASGVEPHQPRRDVAVPLANHAGRTRGPEDSSAVRHPQRRPPRGPRTRAPRRRSPPRPNALTRIQRVHRGGSCASLSGVAGGKWPAVLAVRVVVPDVLLGGGGGDAAPSPPAPAPPGPDRPHPSHQHLLGPRPLQVGVAHLVEGQSCAGSCPSSRTRAEPPGRAGVDEFRTTPATWSLLNDSTVTFVIPDGEVIDEVPSFLRTPEVEPSVLIRYSRSQSSYFLTFEDLQRFVATQPTENLNTFDSISFVFPRGTELVEELPALRRALLQSHTQ